MFNFFQKRPTYPTNEILDVLNAANKKSQFVVLDNVYFYLIASRLHVFQRDSLWAIISEVMTYATRSHGVSAINNIVQAYGTAAKVLDNRLNATFFDPVSDVDIKNPFV